MEEKRLVILGAGESGIGAALLAKAKGFVPYVSDASTIKSEYKQELQSNFIAFEEGKHDESLILSADMIVKSPGIPKHIEVLKKARERNIEIVSEIEFASRFTKAKIIAITGTNGKTTTSLLAYYLLKEGGLNACLAGNIGNSFAREVINDQYDYYILEISSFQLDDIHSFKPDIAILLNITVDHLDRYNGHFDDYVESKFKIIRNMQEADSFIYYVDDGVISEYINSHTILPQTYEISLTQSVQNGSYNQNDILHFPLFEKEYEFTIPTSTLSLKGPHNYINVSAATLAGLLSGLDFRIIQHGLESFENIAHRMEYVGMVQDIEFINDSKATNVDSVRYALLSYNKPIIWIAGGIDKGNDYSSLYSIASNNVKALICLGLDNMKLMESFHEKIEVIDEYDNVEKAVNKAFIIARPGDLVLLSPACASFDLFQNYCDRGDSYKNAVEKLKKNIT
ncbi:UDP-N-acetylmuramoyl-L-alanine--D-glutamate ligase [Bacteroidota bacterium]